MPVEYIDIFNGDADGICALLQWRLAHPQTSRLITGVKRDIQLLQRAQARAGDQITVLDISLDSNRQALDHLLAQQAQIFYVDHHYAGDIPQHENLTAVINTAADTCSSLLMHQYLNAEYPGWAAVGAFGDNFADAARQVLQHLALAESDLHALQQLGEAINYNAYGADIADLHIKPDELYRQLAAYACPLQFIAAQPQLYQQLITAYHQDLQLALTQPLLCATDKAAVLALPDAQWSRRVSGVLGNALANQNPQRAHAVLSLNAQGGYQVSVRAPLQKASGADEFCRRYATGGGRQAAAGINHLPITELEAFKTAFLRFYAD